MMRLRWRGRRTTRVSSRTARFLILHFLVDDGLAGELEVEVGVALEPELDPPPPSEVVPTKLAMAGPGKT
jgi:hypothetical protein